MEPPECPVCLQNYDGAAAIPRVLPCGHTACEPCIDALPARAALPNTIRCPACNQTVRLPRPPGPTALPKNIDLLRLFSPPEPQSSPSNPNPNPNPNPKPKSSPPEFIPQPWSNELFTEWKRWILPSDALTVSDETLIATWRRSGDTEVVTLLPLSTGRREPRWLSLSHTTRVMDALFRLPEAGRTELGALVEAAETQRRGVCRIRGLWMDPAREESPLFLVFERFDRQVGRKFDVEDDFLGFGMVSMELCEAVMGLHSRGFICGCLTPACFRLDEYGHCVLDLSSVLLTARSVREDIGGTGRAFVSPEVFASLSRNVGAGSDYSVGSDAWSLAFALVMLLLGDEQLAVEQFEGFCGILLGEDLENLAELASSQYEVWREKLVSKLETVLLGTRFDSLLRILESCLAYDLESRPKVRDIWHCIRGVISKAQADDLAALNALAEKENSKCCLTLGSLCSFYKKMDKFEPGRVNGCASDGTSDGCLEGNSQMQPEKVDDDIVEGVNGGGLKSITLNGHHDCVTSLVIGGGFLFSSSFDKTIRVWSLQDFSLVQSLKGHEHKVMAMVVVDGNQPLCISGDSGSAIFVWSIGISVGLEPLKKWNETNDWRYSGIHSLAVSETGYLYSGGGDKSIKAWYLKDYSLSCTMTGHRSTVSSLTVASGILYSGSWDGTIRLWSLDDHSLLSILGDDKPGSMPPVMALSVNFHILASSYENGCLKIWKNDVLTKSTQIQSGAIFALHVDAKLLFTGGWDKILNIQGLSENELQVDISPIASIRCDAVITSLLYWHGKLFVGFSNKEIKVYSCGSQ